MKGLTYSVWHILETPALSTQSGFWLVS